MFARSSSRWSLWSLIKQLYELRVGPLFLRYHLQHKYEGPSKHGVLGWKGGVDTRIHADSDLDRLDRWSRPSKYYASVGQ